MEISDIETIIKKKAPEIAAEIVRIADPDISHNEAEFRTRFSRIIEDFAKEIDLTISLREEYTLVNGRADAVYNRLVVEYEPPRSLRRDNSYRPNKHAIEQVKTYIQDLHGRERHKMERIAGVAVDGSFFVFVRFKDDLWHIDDPVRVSASSTEKFLRYLNSLSLELALTPESLVRDFGENTDASRRCVKAFYEVLDKTASPKVKTLFSQWSLQFSEVAGYQEDSDRLDIKGLASRFGVNDPAPSAFRLFYAIHSYYATFIKLLAVQITSYYAFPKLGTGLQQVASYDSARLLSYLKDMERGGIFKTLGINNFLEGDFFGWYLDAWDENIEGAVRLIISDLSKYSLVTLDVDPDETRDLLKKLYQNLMPRQLRHDLGEYYTPDWLAERLLNQLEGGNFKGDPNKRLLDPACGSGTFLVLAIKKIRQYCTEKMIQESEVLEKILRNVVGFDLNPLAVISARTNYLLALGDLLAHRRGEIDIPVYIADSIVTPSEEGTLFGTGALTFKTAVGSFSVPQSLVTARNIDILARLLEESVEAELDKSEFRQRLLGTLPLDVDQSEKDIILMEELYEKLLELEKNGVNGIWARIIKNAFAPLFATDFDFVAGNPPWVNWESLPDEYRSDTVPLWMKYGLFPHSGMDTILGRGKKDISMLMSYVAMDKYLKTNGKLGFVITQSVFKTSGAGQGFRRFLLGNETPVAVVHVDDMVEIKPFEGVGNRTSVIILRKGRGTEYPVPYTHWRKKTEGSSIPMDSTLENAISMTRRKNFVAEPVDGTDPTSSWLTGKPLALKATRKVLGKSCYQAHEGVNTGGANGVYWVNIVARRPDGFVVVSNITEGARRKVEGTQAAIEPDLLYPLLRGRDVRRWKAEPSAFILMVQDPVKRIGIPEAKMKQEYPKSYAYLKRFENILRGRRSQSVRHLMEKGAFYSMFAVAGYTFAQYKVVWREVSNTLDAAVAEPRDTKCDLPDHTLVLLACESPEEAHFACAALNSSPCRFAVQNYIVLHPDPHVLDNICLPKFDRANRAHRELAELSVQAHAATRDESQGKVATIEAGIDTLAARVWGLTDSELKEIQSSLADLS